MLTKTQATEAIDRLLARDQRPAKAQATTRRKLLKDWADGRAFLLESIYFGRGNWKGRGVIG